MPAYEYLCKSCNKKHLVYKSLKNFSSHDECPFCFGKTEICVSLPGEGNFGFKPFETDNITGENVLVESRQHKKELMDKHGVCEAG